MPDLFDTSSIPDEREHWDTIADRVAGIAARKSKGGAAEWLAHSPASWVSACLLLVAALLSVFSQLEDAFAASSAAEWTEAIAPADDVGRMIVSPDRPPPISVLLLGGRQVR
jgi:hypothetical protein